LERWLGTGSREGFCAEHGYVLQQHLPVSLSGVRPLEVHWGETIDHSAIRLFDLRQKNLHIPHGLICASACLNYAFTMKALSA